MTYPHGYTLGTNLQMYLLLGILILMEQNIGLTVDIFINGLYDWLK